MFSIACEAGIDVLSGDNQTGAVNSTLAQPLVVEVDCSLSLPIPSGSPPPCGIVDWTSSEPGDSFSTQQSGTSGPVDASVSSTMLTLGPALGTRTIRASNFVVADVITFTITATQAGTGTPVETSEETLRQAQQETALGQAASTPRVTLVNAVSGNRSMQSHISGLHGGGSPKKLNLDSLNLNIDGTSISTADIQHWLQSDSGGGAGDPLDFLSDRLGFFINGNFSFGDRPTTAQETGFDFNMLGTTLGLDYWIFENFYTGIAFGYTGTDSDYDQSAGGTDINTYSLNVYGSWNQADSFYLDFLFRYGWSDYETNRNFTTAGSQQSAKADYDGTDYSFAVNGGYNFVFGQTTVQPYARFEYVAVDTDSYRETANTSGATPSLLAISQQNLQSLRTALGARASYAMSTGFGVFVPNVHAEWVHEFENDSRTLTSNLINIPSANSVSVLTDKPDRDFVNIGASVSGIFADGLSGFLSYEALIGNRLLFQNTFNIGLRVEL